jgi:hypothetical protein
MTQDNTLRAKALKQISAQMPSQNQALLNQQQQAAQVQARTSLAQAQPGQTSARAVQGFAGQTAQNMGQNLVQNAVNQAQQNKQVQGMALQQQGASQAQQLGERQNRLGQQALQNENKLFQLDSRAKDELFNKRYNIDQKKLEQGFMNEMQLLDWAVTNAQSQEQFETYKQQVEQDTDRALRFMEHSYDMLLQDLNQKFASAEQKKDFQSMRNIEYIKASVERDKKRAENRAANTKAVIGGAAKVAKIAIGAM